MANVRIKDLTTTAATTASDDFFGVDGATNGTRKLNAFSPTFGGNMTVSGTGDFTGALKSDANGSYPGALSATGFRAYSNSVTGLTMYGRGTDTDVLIANRSGQSAIGVPAGGYNTLVYGNLTVSGTGNSTFAGNIRLPWSTPSLLSYYDATYSLGFVFDSTNRKLVLRAQSADAPANGKGTIAFESGATPSEIARFAPSTGNFLLGTTTDSANGRVQLATHTTSAGGIGFGTDISLYRDTNSTLNGTAPGGYALTRTGINGVGLATGVNVASDAKTANDAIGINLSLQNSSSAAKTYGQIYAEINSATASSENGSLVLRTIKAGTLTTALTLDSSQRTILSGALRLANSYVATPQVSTGYVTIQDSTGTTYKVLVAP